MNVPRKNTRTAWGLGAAIALSVWIVRNTTRATVPLAAVGLILLISLAIALSIWVAVRFGHRVRRMGRTD